MSARILIVDDSLTIRRALEMILKPEGYELQLAATGKDALEAAANFDPQLILLDYVLPDMRGPDVCAALEEIPLTQSTPVVLVSAKGTSIRQAYEDAQNVVSYITKPFKPKVVLSVVSHALAENRHAAPPRVDRPAQGRSAPQRGGLQSVEVGFRHLLQSLEETASLASQRSVTTDNQSILELLDKATSEVLTLRRRRERIPRNIHLNPQGQIIDPGAELVAAHTALCQASLLLARTQGQYLRVPVVPSRILVSTSAASVTEALESEISEAEKSRWIFLYRHFELLPHLAAILQPEVLLLDGPPDETLTRALQRLPERSCLCRLGSNENEDPADADLPCHESLNTIPALTGTASPPTETGLPEVVEL
jgi:DNA-binding response OmpR family regulator